MTRLPKYLAISAVMIARIRSGALEPGMRLPSENEIIRDHGVSNTTARKALAHVEQLGYATRIKGRGTFVRERAVVRSATRILSFSQNMRQAGRVPSTRVLETAVHRRPRAITIEGRRYTLEPPSYRVLRLRFADGEPILLEERFISVALCPELFNHDLTGSLYRIYEGGYGLHLAEIKQRISAVILDEATRRVFGLEDLTPGMLIEGVTFSAKELILEIEHSIYRGDTYQFTVRATGQAGAAGPRSVPPLSPDS